MKVLMPQLGETVAEGTVAVWRKRVGDQVELDEILADVETDKAAVEIPAGAAGLLAEIRVLDGETVDVGTVLAIIDDGSESSLGDDEPTVVADSDALPVPAAASTAVHVAASPAAAPRERRSGTERLSPVVRRLLSENGLVASAVAGTGRDGRVTRRDVLAALASRPAAPAPAPSSQTTAVSAHVLQAVEVDFSNVYLVSGGSRPTLPFIAHAVCRALREYPNLNASVDGDAYVMHRAINLGVGIDLGPQGVTTPVITSADMLSVSELEARINELSARARADQLTAEDLAQGTYTISNFGSYGTLLTAPRIIQPQLGILSMGAVRKRPVVLESATGDTLAIRPVGILSQSFDHRAVDGAYSGSFLARVRELLEQTDWSAEI